MRSPSLLDPLHILLLLFVVSLLASADQNVTIDNLDSTVVLNPLVDWGWSNQGHGKNGGTFAFSNTLNATAVFTFPENATAVFWQGFKRSGPALYSVCIDCTDPSQATLVDGHDSSQQSTDSVTILFSQTNLSNFRHVLALTNLVDPRFASPSQITLDAFLITIPGQVTSSKSGAAAAAHVPQTTIMTNAPSPTTVGYWSEAHSRAVPTTGAIVGIVFGVVIALLGTMALVWWLLRRRRGVYGKVYGTVIGHHNEKGPAIGDESPMSSTLKIPPRNADEATMFGTTTESATLSHISYKFRGPDSLPSQPRSPLPATSPPPPSGSLRGTFTPPPAHSSNPPSIRSAIPSMLSQPTRRSANSEWGTITVGISNPFASPRDTGSRSTFSVDTAFPSSPLESSFIMSEVDALGAGQLSNSRAALQTARLQGPRMGVSSPVPTRRGGEDSGRTPTVPRGWRRV